MEIFVNRFSWTENSTLSQWIIDGDKLFFSNIYEAMIPVYSLEDKDRDLHDWMTEDEIKSIKVHGKTAIPYGRYKVIINFSNRFQKEMPLLLNVKGFEGVRFHNGSFIKDTEGCPLVGYKWSLLRPENNFMVSQSKDCFKEVFDVLKFKLQKEECFINIVK